MKLKAALKKFNFITKLDVKYEVLVKLANQLAGTLKGSTEIYKTPLALSQDPAELICELNEIFNERAHELNPILLQMEMSNYDKLGSRSFAIPWSERLADFRSTYSCQKDGREFTHHEMKGPGNLFPCSFNQALARVKESTSSGLPFMTKKYKSKKFLEDPVEFEKYLHREDPAVLFTRTQEKKKTRSVWGFPYALTVFEFQFFVPMIAHCKKQPYHASLVSKEAVESKMTEIILFAMETSRIIYSVDFAGFDASVWYQHIIAAFNYIKSCFDESFGPYIDYICERFYTIGIVTPTGIYRGKHGVPSGSGFTNLIDCFVQLGVALNCKFIDFNKCLVNGDDGVYTLFQSEVPEFNKNFLNNGLRLELNKSIIGSNFAIYCQLLYHYDYMEDGVIHGIYPIYRAFNRLMFQEKFVNFKKLGIPGKDYYGIRAITILEDCKHHPFHEDFVRFILSKEKYNMDVSQDSITKYCNSIYVKGIASPEETYSTDRYDSNGILDFVTSRLVKKILAENALLDEIEETSEGQ